MASTFASYSRMTRNNAEVTWQKMRKSTLSESRKNRPLLPSCAEIQSEHCDLTSGIFPIALTPCHPLDVYCDLATSGGGWTVIQRRVDGSVDFYRGWDEYKRGFGDKEGEFWLGLDNIHAMTSQRRYRVRFDLEDFEGNTRYAEYDDFRVGDEAAKYQLVSVGTYSGTAGDSLAYHKGSYFSTRDRDNDVYIYSCAVIYEGAWWFKSCIQSHLNGHYHVTSSNAVTSHGIIWYHWHGYGYSLKKSEIKVRPY
ncbi:ficolin-2 [Nematostella vectensis]|nr:ficolin-2 [Nematostella vectensis]